MQTKKKNTDNLVGYKQAELSATISVVKNAMWLALILLTLVSGCTFRKYDSKREKTNKTPEEQAQIAKSESTSQKQSVMRETKYVLSSCYVRDISAGTNDVWIATHQGANRYVKSDDRWEVYTYQSGLNSNDVTAVAVDGDSVWIGTRFGLNQYDLKNNKFSSFKHKEGLAHNHVTDILVDGRYVWIGTKDGISRYDKTLNDWALKREKQERKILLNRVNTIAADEEFVWIGTEGGVWRYDKSKDTWNTYTKNEGLIDDNVSSIAIADGSVWIGTSDFGISEYSKADRTFIRSYTKNDLLKSDLIEAIASDGSSVWIGTAEFGLQRYIARVNTWMEYTRETGLASNHITCIELDGNNVWFGTPESGVSLFQKNDNIWTTYTEKDFLVSNDIKSITADDDSVWVATRDGISQYNLNTQSWHTYTKLNGLPTNYVTSLTNFDNQIWAGTSMGLGTKNSGQWKFYTEAHGLSDNFVTSIATVDSQMQLIWIGTRSGLCSFEPEQDKFKTYLPNIWITAVTANNTQVWAGARQQLYKYDENRDTFELVTEFDARINVININKNGLQIGTTKGIQYYPVQSIQLSDENVRAIYDDGRNLWAGTPNGLYRREIQDRSWSKFTVDNSGLPHNNVRAILPTKNGILWFGTEGGVGVFNPADNKWTKYRTLPTVEMMREEEIQWLELDNGQLWASNWDKSMNGAIVKFDYKTQTWTRYTKEDVLLQVKIPWITHLRHIKAGRRYVWFATNNGLLKYDKHKDLWHHIIKGGSDSIANNRVNLIEIDGEEVWVAHEGGLLSHYRPDGNPHWELIEAFDPERYKEISSIAITKRAVWVTTRLSGLRRYDKKTGKWRTFGQADGMAGDRAMWVSADERYVWAGGWRDYSWVGDGEETENIISRYDPETGEWRTYGEADGIPTGNGMRGHAKDKSLWCYGREGGNRYDEETDTWTAFTDSEGFPARWANAVLEDGTLTWWGTGEGVCVYDELSGVWTTYGEDDGLPSAEVNEYALVGDERYIWAGTDQGLSRYDKARDLWFNFVRPESIADRAVIAVAADERYVWCGTHLGLSRYDKKTDRWTTFTHLEPPRFFFSREEKSAYKEEARRSLVNNNITSLSVDEKYVWVATEGGVGRYDKVASRWESYTVENQLPSNDVRAIDESKTNVWIGTGNGISKHVIISEDRNAWETYNAAIEVKPQIVSKEYATSLAHDDVRCLAVTKNQVWVGTKEGVSFFNTSSGIWHNYTEEDGLASNTISDIAVNDDTIWFASGHGVTIFNPSKNRWRTITKADGLASNQITCIEFSNGNAWFGTFDAGVTVWNRKDNTWKTFTQRDGLPHNSILSIEAFGENIWIGTHGGLTRYNQITDTWTVFTRYYDKDL